MLHEWFLSAVRVGRLLYIFQGGPQISLTLSTSQEGNRINPGVTASLKLRPNNEQLFLELGPENYLVCMVLNNVPTILLQ